MDPTGVMGRRAVIGPLNQKAAFRLKIKNGYI